MVSEIMLQQTQVSRVIPKYQAFIAEFPSVTTLAAAPLAQVLRAWSGLGYNRRAQYLHTAAKQVSGPFPQTMVELTKLPGVGLNTAAAIMNYAYNHATSFVETNIRTVYFHHYFHDQTRPISDKEVMQLVAETIDHENPREWFWALMDYGAHLKTTVGSLNNQSKHYAKQPSFNGSRRQIRGQVIRLLNTASQSHATLARHIPDERLASVLNDLVQEGLIVKTKTMYNTPHDI